MRKFLSSLQVKHCLLRPYMSVSWDIIALDNGLLPVQHSHAFIWTNDDPFYLGQNVLNSCLSGEEWQKCKCIFMFYQNNMWKVNLCCHICFDSGLIAAQYWHVDSPVWVSVRLLPQAVSIARALWGLCAAPAGLRAREWSGRGLAVCRPIRAGQCEAAGPRAGEALFSRQCEHSIAGCKSPLSTGLGDLCIALGDSH